MATDRTEQAKQFLARVTRGLESVPASAEGMAESALARAPVSEEAREPLANATRSAARKVATGETMTSSERFALEAIIIPDKRPAVDIIDGSFQVAHPDWTTFNTDPIKANLLRVIPSVGRIELPHHPTMPYGGTGFVVGEGLLMTNRHVAQIFSSGLGLRNLAFLPGREAGVDFKREKGRTESNILVVREVVMIHPYWDMALLRVDGIGPEHPPLSLTLTTPEELMSQDVAVIGYPAFDPRNDANVQNTVFGGVYYVKRLQPGKVGPRRTVESFEHDVPAVTHDSSTLGGNSGSVVALAKTGQVIGLHFAGVYLDANFAVPSAELAQDGRVIDAGVNFQPAAQPDSTVSQKWWDGVQTEERAGSRASTAAPPAPRPAAKVQPRILTPAATPKAIPLGTTTVSGREVTFTVPLEISVRLGAVEASGTAEEPTAIAPADAIGAPPKGDPTLRAQAALAEGPVTFRDHFVSLYQSAVDDIAGKIAAGQKAGIESLAVDQASELVLAAQDIAQSQIEPHASSQPGATVAGKESMLEGMSVPDHARACASLGWQYMQAKVFGDTVTAKRLEGELDAGGCDPRWAQTIEQYVKYFGVGGTRAQPQYVTPGQAGEAVLVMKKDAKIGLVGDWGTGAEPAQRVLQQLKEQKPDILIHLGDIYYSGTEEECVTKFEAIVNRTFDRPRSKLPVYTLAGNHDMYCGGVGYYGLISRLNSGLKGPNGKSMVQPASFFCLRAEDDSWQLLAMDTGRHDYSPFSVTAVVTFVEPDEQEWLARRMREFSGRTILLSHHQLFSAFSQIGARGANGRFNPVNPKLSATYTALTQNGKGVAAWYWGHEHNLCIYGPYAGLERGRCLGHSAIPVFVDDTPYDTLAGLDNPPRIVPNTMVSKAGQFYTHGFAVLSLGSNGTATADYFEDLNGAVHKMHTEAIT